MFDEFTFELRNARRKSGLTQADCGHLVNVSVYRISKLESGKTAPSLREVLALSVLYGRTFECLYGSMMQDIRHTLMAKIETLPDGPAKGSDAERRGRMLENLWQRLLIENQSEYAG